jgi:hypothetical protein
MKQIATLLTAIIVCFATSVTTSAQDQNMLPKKFFGCTLNETTNLDAKIYLESNGFVPSDYTGGFYYITDPKFDDIKYDLALLEFTPRDMASDVFSAITFMKSGLSKKDAIKFANKVHAKLDKNYTLIKKTVDGFDCYFTSNDGRTLTLLVGKGDDSHFVYLVIEPGTPKLQ